MEFGVWYTVRVKQKATSEVERVKLHFEADQAAAMEHSSQDELMEILYKKLKQDYKSVRWFALDKDYHN